MRSQQSKQGQPPADPAFLLLPPSLRTYHPAIQPSVHPSIHPPASPPLRFVNPIVKIKNPKSDDQTWHVRSINGPPLTAASLLRTKVTRAMPCKRTSKSEEDKTATRQPSPILLPPSHHITHPITGIKGRAHLTTLRPNAPSTNTSTSTSQLRKARRLREQQRPSRPDYGSYFLGEETRPGRAPAWHQHQHQRQHQDREHCSSSSPVQSGGRGLGMEGEHNKPSTFSSVADPILNLAKLRVLPPVVETTKRPRHVHVPFGHAPRTDPLTLTPYVLSLAFP
ncbi:uncharacterized protein BDZ83DRAFT_197502 [Colletotrichum acutatum]|uniref:Uncharacterized protein n=1 Tax=Glomerella acutata TaxID=27357 RepID=A0AAD8UWJ3_GLOAC|nr:uncharacterized protein BDZ83DRAFT_197502 [Colletotrichum acutatum]KAK1727615.1 hypothetical protein BDZ83DRAFT_197502 [Colletotrichum acutatum]